MHLWCIAALILSAVAARPDSRRPWQKLPAHGPKLEEEFKGPGFMTNEPGVPSPGLLRHSGRPRGPPRGRLPDRRNPGALVFTPSFKVDNVTFQNVSGVTLKEGENVFLTPRGGRGHHHHRHHHKGGQQGPPMIGQYVKIIYNATEPNKVSIEYGVLKSMDLGKLVGGEYNSVDEYW